MGATPIDVESGEAASGFSRTRFAQRKHWKNPGTRTGTQITGFEVDLLGGFG